MLLLGATQSEKQPFIDTVYFSFWRRGKPLSYTHHGVESVVFCIVAAGTFFVFVYFRSLFLVLVVFCWKSISVKRIACRIALIFNIEQNSI